MMYLNRRKVAIKYIVDQCRGLLLGSVHFLPNDLLGEVVALNKNPENDRSKNKDDDLCNERRQRERRFFIVERVVVINYLNI